MAGGASLGHREMRTSATAADGSTPNCAQRGVIRGIRLHIPLRIKLKNLELLRNYARVHLSLGHVRRIPPGPSPDSVFAS